VGTGDSQLSAACIGSNRGFDASQFPNEEEGIGIGIKKGRGNPGFSGHVHFIKYDDFQREQALQQAGLLWCVPDTRTGE